jgi:hypothetical protein
MAIQGTGGQYIINSPGNGYVVCETEEQAVSYGTQAAFDANVAANEPTFVTWTAALTTFQGTTPTVGQLNSWLSAHPPSPD